MLEFGFVFNKMVLWTDTHGRKDGQSSRVIFNIFLLMVLNSMVSMVFAFYAVCSDFRETFLEDSSRFCGSILQETGCP